VRTAPQALNGISFRPNSCSRERWGR
jgi:hypothetical protein